MIQAFRVLQLMITSPPNCALMLSSFRSTTTCGAQQIRIIRQIQRRPLRACIAAGTESLVSLGFYVSNTGVQENDRVFLELAP